MEATGREDVLWSPSNVDQFLCSGSELQVFEISPHDELGPGGIHLFPSTFANLKSSISTFKHIRCVAWQSSPGVSVDGTENQLPFIAVGQNNGQICLTQPYWSSPPVEPDAFSAPPSTSANLPPVLIELHPKQHQRSCLSLDWSLSDPNFLVGTLDKYKSEPSLYVWDTQSLGGVASPVALYQYGNSECTNCASWSPHTAKRLALSLNGKQIKLVDLRDSSKACLSTMTKAVFGLSFDHYVPHRLASFGDNQVHLWDLRSLERPVVVLNEEKPVRKIGWCPTRNGLLACLQKDVNVLILYDLQPGISDDTETSFVERTIVPPCPPHTSDVSPGCLTSFAWHPKDESRILFLDSKGDLTDYSVLERFTLNFSPTNEVVWSQGKKLFLMNPSGEDVSVLMRERAIQGYGLQEEVEANASILPPGEHVAKCAWEWLSITKQLQKSGAMKPYVDRLERFPGVCSILVSEGGSILEPSTSKDLAWIGLQGTGKGTQKVFESELRTLAARICGWGYLCDSLGLSTALDKLVAAGEVTRAAAMAVFHLQVRKAIDILQKCATHQRNLKTGQKGSAIFTTVAMALSGFSGPHSSNHLWRSTCSQFREYLGDPYLSALFAFLTSSDESTFKEILRNPALYLRDRLSLAISFLSDVELLKFLESLRAIKKEKGDLEGLVLLGFSTQGIDLLQKYVDVTGDVQTAALLAAHGCLVDDVSPRRWIMAYTDLLDAWGLWHQRALLDAMVVKGGGDNRAPPPQVFISCYFCGQSISPAISHQPRGGPVPGALSASPGKGGGRSSPAAAGATGILSPSMQPHSKGKTNSCRWCRKPLPRCSICLVHMGGGILDNDDSIGSWFCWCQTCRHGGHAAHLMVWFSKHSRCPVSGCPCRCLMLDENASFASDAEVSEEEEDA